MKRPLAVFGFAYLIAMLAATRIPLAAILPCLLLLAAAFGLAFLLYNRKKAGATAPVVLAAACAALLVFLGHHFLVARPVQALAGRQFNVQARVTQAATSYGGDAMDVTLEVLDGVPGGKGTRVRLVAFPEVQIGDVVEMELQFYALNSKTAASSYAKGMYVGARVRSTPVVVGRSVNLLCAMRLLQYKASEIIRTMLPGRLSSVAVAMAVGDSRFLSSETKAAYRMAGLSHTLVVSGMHLSVLCGAMAALFVKLFRRKRVVSVLCMGLVLLFMAFTGFTPSIVRSGIAYSLIYSATLFRRKADIYTSLGVAALLLCTQNPFAAADVGLLLSFTATLGALASGQAGKKLQAKWGQKPVGKGRAVARKGLVLLLSPLCVTVATLPVLLLFNLGVAPLSLLINIVALPLLTPVVLGGIGMALLGGLPLVGWLAKPLAAMVGFALVLLEWHTNLCARFDFLYLYISGALALALLLLYPLGLLAAKTKKIKAFAVVGAVVVLAGALLHTGLRAGTVQVTMAGSGSNPSLVVTQGTECVIIYRDRRTAYAVQQIMQQQGAKKCVLFVDLRKTNQSTEYLAMFAPQQVVVAGADLIGNAELTPFTNTTIWLQKQGEGMLACVDIEGYRVGTTTGAVNMGLYAPVDVFVAGSGATQGLSGQVLANGAWPDWLQETDAPVLTRTGQTAVVIRPGKSVLFKEASTDGMDG
ncbi:ComEC/Rec2 family competence protein [Ruminococcaceae bacterium OttesenSCG-928-A16]|nr:ComEC/Rec2 family competence protein [Ruminococcaceae bacterium OttesenSCG-928-A16]